MGTKKAEKSSRYIGLYGSLSLMFSIIVLVVVALLFELEKNKQAHENYLTQDILHKAIAHFDNMVLARSWNASFGAVYVKEQNGIKPNIYLKDNVMHSDKNETLIRINPAWMTRQISEISNKNASHFYKITSLKPLNPINKPDTFEEEALKYFEKNKADLYYWNFQKSGNVVDKFNFMGSLKVDESCLPCHQEQGYKVGDIKGGIRVTMPIDAYNEGMLLVKKSNDNMRWIILTAALIIASLLSFVMQRIFTHQSAMAAFNKELEVKVAQRTQELLEVNDTLESRVVDEVEKNRKKDEAILTQSRYQAMGEIMEMISHQWRQPITVIGVISNNLLINLELGMDDKDEMKKSLEKISTQIQTLSKIITEFSNLFESDSVETLTRPCKIVNEILDVMQNNFKHYNIKVDIKCENKDEIMLMSKEFFQVCWNIINNAKEILIERKIINPKITIAIEESESEVVASISDNAGGIKKEYLSKICEPYFSTKEDLNGKGLGLYISKSIVDKQLHGSLSVENDDEGAVFTIRIPKKTGK
ncbi:MAG: DUF3365 domain-containing protein [Campylobacterales bacterium]|nr:DUF3365 domain-containing protein [Campylobacterales bacterium]